LHWRRAEGSRRRALASRGECGRIQVTYASTSGLFDHLKEAVVLDFGDSPQMRGIFEALIDEYRNSGPATLQ